MGVVADPDHPTRSQAMLVLGSCEPNGACGTLDLRQVNGTGCTYELDAGPPAADAWSFALINAGSIDCEDDWSSAELLVRPTTTGSLAVSRVFEGVVDRSFTLAPATPSSQPSPAPSATADRTTVARGQTVTVTVSAFGAGSDVWITLERSSVLLGRGSASEDGMAVVVVRIPSNTPIGHDSILVEGIDRNGREFGLLIPLTITD